MEVYFLIGIVVAATAVVIKLTVQSNSGQKETSSTPKFIYSRKDSIMTDAEARFFHRLQYITEDRYFVFPQIHLSALLKNDTKGKYWKAAFQRINRTSVDYALVHKDSLQVAYVVELDDWSHDSAKRRSRDAGVEEMLRSASIPIVRFRNVVNMTDEDVINAFRVAQQR